MKVAFVGKGGAGKTTLSALFARYVASLGLPIITIDADINQQLGEALGASQAGHGPPPSMGSGIDAIKAYLRGENPRIASCASMIKTTPPGSGSRLITVTEHNPVYEQFARSFAGIRMMAAGAYAADDLGVKCYHAKTGAVELVLNHLVDGAGEYVVVDMTAGADAFASGLFTRFDVTFILVEPTLKALAVYDQYVRYAAGHGVTLKVVANKLTSAEDVAVIQRRVGDDFLTGLECSAYVRRAEQGHVDSLCELEPCNRAALARMLAFVDEQAKDWDRFYRHAVEFHLKNAEAWANRQMGLDLGHQVDPQFDLKDAAARTRAGRTQRGRTDVIDSHQRYAEERAEGRAHA
jgi:CO dehydrogenase maturation factor